MKDLNQGVSAGIAVFYGLIILVYLFMFAVEVIESVFYGGHMNFP